MDPPAYEAIESKCSEKQDLDYPHAKIPTRLSLRDEVYTSRLQHVAALVVKLLPHIRARAKQGLSKTSLLILPSDSEQQEHEKHEQPSTDTTSIATSSSQGQLVGFPEDLIPIVIQLEGGYDGTQFWTQKEVITLLREQTLAAVADVMPHSETTDVELPVRPSPEPRSSFWGRKQSKAPTVSAVARSGEPPVTVEVEQDLFSFRAETQYGLFETLRVRAVLITVDVK